jgi:hypothetical protein
MQITWPIAEPADLAASELTPLKVIRTVEPFGSRIVTSYWWYVPAM